MENKEKNNYILIRVVIGILILFIIFLIFLKGCTKKEFTVKFDSNGGSIIESIKVKENEKIKEPDPPLKSGYIFDGWYYLDKKFNFNTKITKNITLKAHWTDNDIILNKVNISLLVGSSEQIEILSLPDGVNEEDFIYESKDKNIVTVDENGKIKAIKKGKTIITVKSKDGKYSAEVEVIVKEKSIEVDSVSINGDSTVNVGSSIKLSAIINPKDATNVELKWSSSDETIATVDKDGNVKGLKSGSVTITVTTNNGKTSTKKITVKDNTIQNNNSNSNNNKNNNNNNNNNSSSSSSSNNNNKPNSSGGNTGGNNNPTNPSISPSSISIIGESEVYIGKSINLTAIISPENATNKKVSWNSSNNSIATVDQNGRVTGVGKGVVNITVTTYNGKSATKQITVKEVKANYVLHLKILTQGVDGEVFQYSYRVTKDGSDFDGYKSFTINSHSYLKTNSNPTISGPDVYSSGNNATIKLNDDTIETLTVIFG